MSRKLSEARKKSIAGQQFHKCANKPGAKLKGLGDYDCPLWAKTDENRGIFDKSGYDIDHIIEHCISQDDSDENLQALCKMCHAVKTKNFLMNDPGGKKIKNRSITAFGAPIDVNMFSREEIEAAAEDHRGAAIGLIKLFHFSKNHQMYHNVYSATRNTNGFEEQNGETVCILTKHGIKDVDSFSAASDLYSELGTCIPLILKKYTNLRCEAKLQKTHEVSVAKSNNVPKGYTATKVLIEMNSIFIKAQLLMHDHKKMVIDTLKAYDCM